MTSRSLILSSATAALIAPTAALAQSSPTEGETLPATLAAQVVLPAEATAAVPDDAPEALGTAGKFTGQGRLTEVGSGAPTNGVSLPIDGQSLQGFSGIKAMPDGTFWTLSDNGFGTMSNSPDAMLMLHHLDIDWQAGTMERLRTIFLSDPDRVAPFPIAMEGSRSRYLTGADFDVESIQPVQDGFWIGEEFGPYLLKVDSDGRLLSVVDTTLPDGTAVRSPQNPAVSMPPDPTADMPDFNMKRSGGFEGLALSMDGRHAYAMLEAPIYVDGTPQTADDGRAVVRVLELDTDSGDWTGRSWLYPLAEGAAAIGDFNLIDDTHALVIERDGGQGRPAQACEDGQTDGCFDNPAMLKRVYRVRMGDDNEGGLIEKLAHIDLLDIADPDGVAEQGTEGGTYTMPFVTIENVDRADATHIVVANDNNFPFSAGRALGEPDDNEFVLIEAPGLLSGD